ncbi:MAG: NAD-dependent epimerase/dehydratase family protein [Actinomycetota bacterium]|nr:NAD-dependent epimerase/dehydratase family protein [Actinomycetota bacterium]
MARRVPVRESSLTVAVTGPTGTLGSGLLPLLQADDRIGRVVGVARRRFDPAAHGWSKMEYRRGDVRDVAALEQAFAGADVVVHLAFIITGTASRETIRAVNIEGTLTAFRAAAAAGAKRFVYASSVAAYGFHRDNPAVMTEEWPVRRARHLFYAQEKADLECLLYEEAAAFPGIALFLVRPPIVLGPNAVGAKDMLPRGVAALGRGLLGLVDRLPVALPVAVAPLPMQFIHEEDVGSALVACIVAAGPPGAYNIAADGLLTTADVARELGLAPLPVPVGLAQAAARAVAAVPTPSFVPPFNEWLEAVGRPAIMDAGKARRDLGWEPRYTALEALRNTLRRAS